MCENAPTRQGHHRSGSHQYKAEAINAAKDLGYDRSVINALYKAKDDAEIERIMRNARKGRK